MKTEIVICGAGIAGIAAAYHLAVKHGQKDILLVDDRPPLTLTSDKSTECYRNWWPGEDMVVFMNRSIDLMEAMAEESGNVFHLNRLGYLFLTASPDRISEIEESARKISRSGAGPLRVHHNFPGEVTYSPSPPEGYHCRAPGADLLLEPSLIHAHYPYLSEDVVAALHVRRAGWFSGQQLGMYMLEKARSAGVQLIQSRLTGVKTTKGKISAIKLDGSDTVRTDCLINAAGPLSSDLGLMIGIELPIYCELHQKVAFKDPAGVIARDAPLLIWMDRLCLNWSKDEIELLTEDEVSRLVLEEMPPGLHTRPEGGPDSQIILGLWEYQSEKSVPIWPLPADTLYPEIVLRGLMRMVPGLSRYREKASKPQIDGGYYTKTIENRPLIGKLPVEGAFIIGALSGFGMMSSSAAGELLAAHVMGSRLPSYAPVFSLDRYSDPTYLTNLRQLQVSGQL